MIGKQRIRKTSRNPASTHAGRQYPDRDVEREVAREETDHLPLNLFS